MAEHIPFALHITTASRAAPRTAGHDASGMAAGSALALAAVFVDDEDAKGANLASHAHLSGEYAEEPARLAACWPQADHGGGHDWGFCVGVDAHLSEGHNMPFSDPAHTPFEDPAWGGDLRRACRSPPPPPSLRCRSPPHACPIDPA